MPNDQTPDPLSPPTSLLAKVGSIAAHAEELFSPDGHPADQATIEALLVDPEVQQWLEQMRGLALLPARR